MNNSEVYEKYLTKSCENITNLYQDLNNGRFCEVSGQCNSKHCNDASRCSGKANNDTCSSNAECDVGLACLPSNIFPFATKCAPLRNIGDYCMSDYECQYGAFCWYATEVDARQNYSTCL